MDSILVDPLGPDVLSEFEMRAIKALPLKPDGCLIAGRFITLKPFTAELHLQHVWDATNGQAYCGHPAYDTEALVWRYLWGAPRSIDELHSKLKPYSEGADCRLWAIELNAPLAGFGENRGGAAAEGTVVGIVGLIANNPTHLRAEIGYIVFSPAFQATPAASEATYLLLNHCFTLGYRRVEWKTNVLNTRSRHTAERLGFQFEGVFRRHFVVQNGHGRDSAWFSLIESDWIGLPGAPAGGTSGAVSCAGGAGAADNDAGVTVGGAGSTATAAVTAPRIAVAAACILHSTSNRACSSSTSSTTCSLSAATGTTSGSETAGARTSSPDAADDDPRCTCHPSGARLRLSTWLNSDACAALYARRAQQLQAMRAAAALSYDDDHDIMIQRIDLDQA